MARTKKSVKGPGGQLMTKSDAVRDYIHKNPKAKMREVSEALKERGIKILHSQIYAVMASEKSKKRRQKRVAAMEVSRSAGSGNPIQLVMKVRDLAMEAGGYRNLKQLVDIMAQ